MRVSGNFYLQSLMELLKVKERVEGRMDFDGKISGEVSKLTGSADATLKKEIFLMLLWTASSAI